MRALPVLLLAFSLMLSGCFGGNDDEPSPPTPTPEPTPEPTTPTPTPTSPTPENETEPEPEAPAPESKEVLSVTYTFPVSASTEETAHLEPFTVDEGYTTLSLNLTFSPSTSLGPLGGGVANGIRVVLLDPAGEEAGEACTLDGPVNEPVTCAAQAPVSAAGEWNLSFSGSGAVAAEASVIAS